GTPGAAPRRAEPAALSSSPVTRVGTAPKRAMSSEPGTAAAEKSSEGRLERMPSCVSEIWSASWRRGTTGGTPRTVRRSAAPDSQSSTSVVRSRAGGARSWPASPVPALIGRLERGGGGSGGPAGFEGGAKKPGKRQGRQHDDGDEGHHHRHAGSVAEGAVDRPGVEEAEGALHAVGGDELGNGAVEHGGGAVEGDADCRQQRHRRGQRQRQETDDSGGSKAFGQEHRRNDAEPGAEKAADELAGGAAGEEQRERQPDHRHVRALGLQKEGEEGEETHPRRAVDHADRHQ